MRSGRQIVFARRGESLQCRVIEVPEPSDGEVLVRVTAAGVCGSDAHRIDGDEPNDGFSGGGREIAFGHEGVGIVEALGPGVATDWAAEPINVGDAVFWAPLAEPRPGGEATKAGATWPPSSGRPSHAAYQDYALLPPEVVFYRIPSDTPPESVVAFGCAMPTALGGLARLGRIEFGQTVVVQGCGPVGLAATLLVALAQAGQVIVIGDPARRLARAADLGATTTISLADTTTQSRAELIYQLTLGRGADVVIEAAGTPSAFGEGMELLAPHGRYLILGLYSGSGTVTLDPYRTNNLSLSIFGSLGASHHRDYRTTIQLAQRYHERLTFVSSITHRFGLERTEEAIATMRTGEAVKAIVVPSLG